MSRRGQNSQKILWSYSNHYFLRGPLQGFIQNQVFFICPPDLIQIFLCPYSLPREDNLYGFHQQAPVPSSFLLGLVTIGEREETEIKVFIPYIPPLLSTWVVDFFWQPVTFSFKAIFITQAFLLLSPGNLFFSFLPSSLGVVTFQLLQVLSSFTILGVYLYSNFIIKPFVN